jgi:hypothetical protein
MDTARTGKPRRVRLPRDPEFLQLSSCNRRAMPSARRLVVLVLLFGGMVLAITLLQRGVGLSVPVERALLVGSLLASALAYGWLNLEGTVDADGDMTVGGSRRAFGALQALFWLSALPTMSLSTLLDPEGGGLSTAAAVLEGPLGALPVAVFVLTFVVLMTRTDVAAEYSFSSLRQQFQEGKREGTGTTDE